jgi:porphobilinogen synthase
MDQLFYRGRRLRHSPQLRSLTEETTVYSKDLIQPIFVVEGVKKRERVESMPGIERVSADQIGGEIEAVREAGVQGVILFGLADKKDPKGLGAAKKSGAVQRAVREIKKLDSSLAVITDVCLCAYTSHGHCGHVKGKEVDNDASLQTLAQVALSHAEAGADVVAPSDMMDGRVLAIRNALDENGFVNTPILSYAAKFASAFYGPFRDAAKSGAQFGDRKSYQMDPPNARQAMREITADIQEGADIVMVKPALAYLDVIAHAKMRFDVPVFAYNVSGEYSMVKAAAEKGWVDEKAVMVEMLTAMKRAGADRIITYFAKSFGH